LYRYGEEKEDVDAKVATDEEDVDGEDLGEAVVDGEVDEGRRRRSLLYWPDSGVNAGKKVDKEEPEEEVKEEEEATPTEDEEVEKDSDEAPEEEEEATEVGLAQGPGPRGRVKGLGQVERS
jgi:hypothetical protein